MIHTCIHVYTSKLRREEGKAKKRVGDFKEKKEKKKKRE
jgi:hypothetical protein